MVNVKYVDFRSDCRLGNQLYFALHAYKCGKILKTDVSQSIDEQLKPLYDVLNIRNYVIGKPTVSWYSLQHQVPIGRNMMCQDFGSCYDEELLRMWRREEFPPEPEVDYIGVLRWEIRLQSTLA